MNANTPIETQPLAPQGACLAPATSQLPITNSQPPIANSSLPTSVNSVSLPMPVSNPPRQSQTSGHSNNSNPQPSKTHAVQTNQNQNSKTLGHSNNPPPKISAAAEFETPGAQPQNPSRPRRNSPVLATLTDLQKQQLVDLYQNHSAKEAVEIAGEQLGIQISVGTLANLSATWQIRDDQDARAEIEATHNTAIEILTEKQLQLRLLQLASRPNMDHTELRAICHSFARLQSVKLSERRVQLAEAKEARLAQNDESPRRFTQEAYTKGINAIFGKPHNDAAPRSSRGNDAQTDSTPHRRPDLPGSAKSETGELTRNGWRE